MIVKVCGMRDPENIRAVEALGIDLMGFIFYDKSPRFCAEVPSYLPTRCRRVGVFVNASVREIVEKTKDFGLDYIQLHGKEDREFVIKLRKGLTPLTPSPNMARGSEMSETQEANIPLIIKALPVKTTEDLKKTEEFIGFVDYFLFDTPTAGYGGSGRKFDWSLLNSYYQFTPFLLSGGIGPDDVEQVKAFLHPQCIGLDLNSKFETAPGLKDVEKLRMFIEKLKQ